MLEILVGTTIIAVLLFDIFLTVLVPRFTPASLRLAPFLISRLAWPNFRKIAVRIKNPTIADFFLGAFAPFAFVIIFGSWVVLMTLSYAFIICGVGAHFQPHVTDVGTAFYLAGTSLITLGFGDIVPVTPVGRCVLLLAGLTGITVVAVGVSFLFSMQQSVHEREVVVNTFQSRLKPIPSAVYLLLSYADLGVANQLTSAINEWESWAAHVLASHRAFPLLCYFRSGHMCVSWITVLGVMLDACNLLSTTVNDHSFGHAEFFLQIGGQIANFFANYFHLQPRHKELTHTQFSRACALLTERGYQLYDQELAWQKFSSCRERYAPALNALAYKFVCQEPSWLEEPVAQPVAGRQLAGRSF
jgi:hypothetical protein